MPSRNPFISCTYCNYTPPPDAGVNTRPGCFLKFFLSLPAVFLLFSGAVCPIFPDFFRPGV